MTEFLLSILFTALLVLALIAGIKKDNQLPVIYDKIQISDIKALQGNLLLDKTTGKTYTLAKLSCTGDSTQEALFTQYELIDARLKHYDSIIFVPIYDKYYAFLSTDSTLYAKELNQLILRNNLSCNPHPHGIVENLGPLR